MKTQTPSTHRNSYLLAEAKQQNTSEPTNQQNLIEARREYYYNVVLKEHGIPNPSSIQKPFPSPQRQERAMAFKERNRSLKFYIRLLQQNLIT